ncbi:periplasmic heavy metal sensor [Sphingomonas glacialis]|uniref:Periplasmic heavy metal sensor n=1 Tax=Sphingomonas glacialis TaxID=658225 RepID=A0A502FCH9_9SPHN|nr:periplasmic heavy metal sensor [Sphingomonas glacialis]TPG47125.1 periplasmic heavy metal sensor [Sphingomonas glacialis]
MRRGGWLVAAMILAFAAAVAGVGVGRLIWPAPHNDGSGLHRLLHHQLDLDAAQTAQLETLEQRYAARRKALEAEMRADNARLAAAIAVEHGYGPRVDAAVTASHMAMGTLQKETLAHVFAMRKLLRPDQAARFDAAVAKSLTPTER